MSADAKSSDTTPDSEQVLPKENGGVVANGLVEEPSSNPAATGIVNSSEGGVDIAANNTADTPNVPTINAQTPASAELPSAAEEFQLDGAARAPKVLTVKLEARSPSVAGSQALFTSKEELVLAPKTFKGRFLVRVVHYLPIPSRWKGNLLKKHLNLITKGGQSNPSGSGVKYSLERSGKGAQTRPTTTQPSGHGASTQGNSNVARIQFQPGQNATDRGTHGSSFVPKFSKKK